MHHLCCLFAVSMPVVVTGCLPVGEDSWRHYQGGGHYPAKAPCMSPDGSVIIFSSPRTGSGDIYQIDRDGSNCRRLTDHPAFETDPIFSPDGLTIAFTREVNQRRHIWLMDHDGSQQRQITSGRVLDDVRSFSPDGSALNFYRSPLSLGMGRSVQCYTIDLRSGAVRELDALPVYSPDGTKATFWKPDVSSGNPGIWTMNADGSNKQFLVSGYSPRFSPDGTTILYSTAYENPGSLWRMCDVDGSNIRDFGRVADPVFASDGEHVLCLSPEWKRQIWKMDLDGSNKQRLPAPTGYIRSFRPCRDGFIFSLVTNDRVGDVYVVNTTQWTLERVASIR